MKKTMLIISIFLMLFCLTFTSYAQMSQAMDMKSVPAGLQLKAVCVLYATQGNSVSGTITFLSTDSGVKVVVDVQGLSKGKHGFHIHEFGDCNSPDGSSAGGHFNPAGMAHGGPMDMKRHMGDMGNLEADESGKAHLEYIDRMISLTGEHSIVGRSVILHKSEDDLQTQPTGNSGARIACGVIGIAK